MDHEKEDRGGSTLGLDVPILLRMHTGFQRLFWDGGGPPITYR